MQHFQCDVFMHVQCDMFMEFMFMHIQSDMFMQARYDEELRNYLKQTGLLASDLAKMRTKRPPPPHHRPPLMHTSAASTAHSAAAWSNGRASPRSGAQRPSAATLPTLFANHDGSVVVGGTAAPTYG